MTRSVWLMLGTLVAAPLTAVSQESTVAFSNDAANREFVITVGPVHAPAPEAGHEGHGAEGGPHGAHAPVFPPIDEVEIPFDVYLHGFSYRIVNGAGEELPVAMLHHLNLIVADSRELFLPISQRLLAVGKETGPQSVPKDVIGVPVEQGQRIVVVAMLHNPTGREHHGVRVEVRLAYVDAAEYRPRYVVYPFQMDIGFPAGDKDVDLPPGRSTFTWEGSPAVPGRILVIGGHLHKYATGLTLEDVTTGTVLWEGLPQYAEDGTIIGVTVDIFDDETAIALDPDHVYRITTTYHNTTSETLPSGGMGVIGGVFHPAEGATWPEADASDRLYRIDQAHYLQKVRGSYEEIVKKIEAGAMVLDGHRR